MRISLEDVNFQLSGFSTRKSDINVFFECFEIDENNLHFSVKAEVGVEEDRCRFILKMLFLVEIEEVFEDKKEMVNSIVDTLYPSLLTILTTLDLYVKNDNVA